MKVVPARLEQGGAGVRIQCALGRPELPHLDPFLRLAHFMAEAGGGFPDHPHRGFETITYLVSGRLHHRDSKGNSGLLHPGGAQRMTAGRGLVHSEMAGQESSLGMSGFQLWLNLPAAEKMCAPRYQDVRAEEIPTVVSRDGAAVRIVSGSYSGIAGPLSGGRTDPTFLDVALGRGSSVSWPIATGYSAFAYVFEGEVRFGEQPEVGEGCLALFADEANIRAHAHAGPARFLFLAAQPLEEPIVHYGPFVMNTAEEIRQAVADYQMGRF